MNSDSDSEQIDRREIMRRKALEVGHKRQARAQHFLRANEEQEAQGFARAYSVL